MVTRSSRERQRGPKIFDGHLKLRSSKMRKVQTISVVLALLLTLTVSAQNNETAKGTNKLAPLPRDLEIQLALSALPPHLRDNATVYVLNPDARVRTDSIPLLLEPVTTRSGGSGR